MKDLKVILGVSSESARRLERAVEQTQRTGVVEGRGLARLKRVPGVAYGCALMGSYSARLAEKLVADAATFYELVWISGQTEDQVRQVLRAFPGTVHDLKRFYLFHGHFPGGEA